MKQIFLLMTIAAGTVLLGAGCTGPTTTSQPTATIPTATTPTPTNPTPTVPTPAPASSVSVIIANFSFQPDGLTAAAGATVTWTNNDSVPHTVKADDGSFSSGTFAPGATFSRTFPAAGSVAYHCAIHPSMRGTLTITK